MKKRLPSYQQTQVKDIEQRKLSAHSAAVLKLLYTDVEKDIYYRDLPEFELKPNAR